MTTLGRRSFLASFAVSTGMLALPRAAWAVDIPPIPLSLAVATDQDHPVVDAAWIEEQMARMRALFGPLGVHPEVVSTRPIGGRYLHLETRDDRDALMAEVRPKVVNVFFVGTLRDVDEPDRMRRGVCWRNRAHPSQRYVIVASEAPPTVLAHEMGHYFGNGHSQVRDNLMSYDRSGADVSLDAAQGRVIRATASEAFRSGELAPPTRTDR
jgi:hypothetical protein